MLNLLFTYNESDKSYKAYNFIVLQNIAFFHFYINYQHGFMLKRRLNNVEKNIGSTISIM